MRLLIEKACEAADAMRGLLLLRNQTSNFSITPYEIIINRKPNIKFFHVFGCWCFIMNLKDTLSKFQSKADKGIFLGYSHNCVAYKVLNKCKRKIKEKFNLTFDD